MIITDFGDLIADRMRLEHRALAARWFERLLDLLPVEARDVFPTETLLDHVPALILEISDYLRQPSADAIAANTAILDKARELGALRYRQRASLHQVLREYQILGRVLVTFVLEQMRELGGTPPAADAVALASRLHEAVNVLSQATVETFVSLYTRTIAEQKERLEEFTRIAAHEWRQPLGTLHFGIGLLARARLDDERFARTLQIVQRNIAQMSELTLKLESIARVRGGHDSPVLQFVPVGTVAQEAARQLREMADARGVEIRVAADLPTLTIDVGRLELVFVNLLSNAIKYSDPAKPRRYVEVAGTARPDGWCEIEVRDNGVGIPPQALAAIFQRFTRAHADREDLAHIPGVGLGLSIAEDCIRAMQGRIEARSTEGEGTTFLVTLPHTGTIG